MRTKLNRCLIAAMLALGLATLFHSGCSQSHFHSSNQTATAPPPGTPYASKHAGSAIRAAERHDPRLDAPAGSLPALDEEVWVIVKHATPERNGTAGSPRPANPLDLYFDTSSREETIPGSGSLMCRMPQRDANDRSARAIPLPLDHTEVRATVNAYIASVDVTQQFTNPYDSKIEAVYVFPLPENAAVNGFVMTVGERRIRGIIREREEAQQIYDAAKSQGYVASLLTQERPNVFTQHVANIEPGKRIDINITYFNTLAYDDGWYEFVFPMVVGPRFNPPATSDGIGAVARNDRGASGQSTEVLYLAPHERSGHDIALTVDLMPGTSVEQIECTSHKVTIENDFSEHVRVSLKPSDSVPNKDFVLRYRVAGENVKTALLVNRDRSGGGYFTFMLIPPWKPETNSLRRKPVEMIFVVDCSGSMEGEPLKQAKAAVDHALKNLQNDDTFQIVQFSDRASQFGEHPLSATPANIRRGRDYVNRLSSDGGTMMLSGLNAALAFPHTPWRTRIITFLTDGFIGNESEVLAAVHNRLGESRIFSFGVGSSVNRYLMDAMARMGGGAVAYLSIKDKGDDVMDAFLARVRTPVLTDIDIDFSEGGGMEVSDVMPPLARLPDLHVGRPLIVTGRFNGEPPASIRVNARSGEDIVEARFPVDLAASQASTALSSVWARMHIASLMDRATWDQRNATELPHTIRMLALEHGLMSSWTSFVAVDSLTQTAGSQGTTVNVAVPVPEGVKYDTTVRGGG